MRNDKIVGELNKIVSDRKKLERIFIDCFEESRKEIIQRKMKDTINWKGLCFNSITKSQTNLGAAKDLLPKINEVKFENFQVSDKRRLVENFILSDEVVNLLKGHFGENITENKTTTGGSFFNKNSFGENFKNLNLDYKNKIGDIKMNNDMNFVSELKKSNSTTKMSKLKIPAVKK